LRKPGITETRPAGVASELRLDVVLKSRQQAALAGLATQRCAENEVAVELFERIGASTLQSGRPSTTYERQVDDLSRAAFSATYPADESNASASSTLGNLKIEMVPGSSPLNPTPLVARTIGLPDVGNARTASV
jgi:hypothetical protein